MKHIRNLWNLLKQEISLWKYEKQELVKEHIVDSICTAGYELSDSIVDK